MKTRKEIRKYTQEYTKDSGEERIVFCEDVTYFVCKEELVKYFEEQALYYERLAKSQEDPGEAFDLMDLMLALREEASACPGEVQLDEQMLRWIDKEELNG